MGSKIKRPASCINFEQSFSARAIGALHRASDGRDS